MVAVFSEGHYVTSQERWHLLQEVVDNILHMAEELTRNFMKLEMF